MTALIINIERIEHVYALQANFTAKIMKYHSKSKAIINKQKSVNPAPYKIENETVYLVET